jgi:hypothetical protein
MDRSLGMTGCERHAQASREKGKLKTVASTVETDNSGHERRSEERKEVNIYFLIKIGRLFKARGVIKDINRKGLCLKCPQLFRPRLSVQAREFVNGPLKISIPSSGITVDGRIAWVDLKVGEGAIRVTNTSDQQRWLEMYDKG